jgi:D-tyrosyl-tRNA(Tyr) deacylase
MNRSLRDIGGGLLIVSQFTLAADTTTGNRPSFTPAADPATGEALYDRFVASARRLHPVVATGSFRAHMRVALVNDGPVTLTLRVPPPGANGPR